MRIRYWQNNKINLDRLIRKDHNLVDIIVVRSANSIIYDPRVKKIVRSLHKKYSTFALGWNRDGISDEKINDYVVKLELFGLKTSFWKPSLLRIFMRLVLFFPPFWTWILIKLLISRPKIVHACDLDTIIPCYLYKLLFGKKLVFDVFDRYGMALVPQKFEKLCSVINFFEDLYAEHSDALVIAGGEGVLRTFKKRPKRCEIILNCPEDALENNTKTRSLQNDNDLKLVYVGGIRRDRLLENLSKALNDLGIEFHIAGPIMDVELFQEIQKCQHVIYHGVLQPHDALTLESNSDVLISFYNPEISWNNITLPNKLFEAMMCGIPIITNVACEIVNESKCGILVDYGNTNQIKQAIITLRDDPELRKRLGDNGRKAFLEKYNWNVMEQRLYQVYANLLPAD